MTPLPPPPPPPPQEVCQAAAAVGDTARYDSSKFTLLLSTWRGERLPLDVLTAIYAGVPSVHSIVVIWHDPTTRPSFAGDSRAKVPVHVYHAKTNSLNNRFLPLRQIKTTGVLSMDDDMVVSPDDLAFAFSVWSEDPARLASPFVRSHYIDRRSGRYTYLMNQNGAFTFRDVRTKKYSMALTKMMFAPTKLLFM